MAQTDTPSGPSTASRAMRWIVGIVAIIFLYPVFRRLGPAIAPQITEFLSWVDSLGFWAPLVFVLGYALCTVAFVPGSLLTMAGGVLFGLVGGTAYVLVGALLGASLAFLISRYLARGMIESRLADNERFELIDTAVAKEGLKIVFLLRLVPFFPFVWLNYGLGLTQVQLRHYVIGSLGMLPGTFLYVYYGKAIGSLASLAQGETAEQGDERWIFLALGLVAAIAVTSVITRIAKKALAEATESVDPDAP